MSVDINMVRRVAKLANIDLDSGQAEKMQIELELTLKFVDQLKEIDIEGVEPMTTVVVMPLKYRADMAIDGGKPEDIVTNAPACEDNFLVTPKVIE